MSEGQVNDFVEQEPRQDDKSNQDQGQSVSAEPQEPVDINPNQEPGQAEGELISQEARQQPEQGEMEVQEPGEIPQQQHKPQKHEEVQSQHLKGSGQDASVEQETDTDMVEKLIEAIHKLERKNFALSSQNSSCIIARQRAQSQVRMLQEQNLKLQQARNHMEYRVVKAQAQVKTVQANRDQYKTLLGQAKEALKEFENVVSTAQLEAKLKLQQLKSRALSDEIEGLKLEIKEIESGTRTAAESVDIECYENVDRLSAETRDLKNQLLQKQLAIEQLKQSLEASQLSRQESVKAYDSQLSVLLSESAIKAQQLQKAESDVNRLNSLLKERSAEIVTLTSKLQQEHSKKRVQGQGSDHLLQKQMVIKDYLQLEQNYQILHEEWERSRSTVKRLQTEIQRLKSTSVSRNDYESLSKRYIRVKKCLEESIKSNSGRVPIGEAGRPSQEEGSGRGQSVFTKHTLAEHQLQQLQTLRKVLDQSKNTTMFEDPETIMQISKLRAQIKQLNLNLEQQAEMICVLEKQLEGKQTLLGNYRHKCNQYYAEAQTAKDELQILKEEYEKLRLGKRKEESEQVLLEAKTAQLVAHVQLLRKEGMVWKQAYQAMKAHEQMTATTRVSEGGKVRDWLEQPNQKRIEVQLVRVKRQVVQANAQTQTMSVQLQLQEVESRLQRVRIAQDKANKVVEELNRAKDEMERHKQKLKHQQERYNHKLKQVTEEKREQEQWRIKTREQIERQVKEQFLELRELVEGQRLLKTLRKAKFILEEYEKQAESQQHGDQEDKPEQGLEL